MKSHQTEIQIQVSFGDLTTGVLIDAVNNDSIAFSPDNLSSDGMECIVRFDMIEDTHNRE